MKERRPYIRRSVVAVLLVGALVGIPVLGVFGRGAYFVWVQERVFSPTVKTRHDVESRMWFEKVEVMTDTNQDERETYYKLKPGEKMVRYDVFGMLFFHVAYDAQDNVISIIPCHE